MIKQIPVLGEITKEISSDYIKDVLECLKIYPFVILLWTVCEGV